MEKPAVKPGDKCSKCGSKDTVLLHRSSLRFNKRLKCQSCGTIYEAPLSLVSRVAWVLGALILCAFGIFMILAESADPEVPVAFQRFLGLLFWTAGIIVAYRGLVLNGAEIFNGSEKIRNIYEHI